MLCNDMNDSDVNHVKWTLGKKAQYPTIINQPISKHEWERNQSPRGVPLWKLKYLGFLDMHLAHGEALGVGNAGHNMQLLKSAAALLIDREGAICKKTWPLLWSTRRIKPYRPGSWCNPRGD